MLSEEEAAKVKQHRLDGLEAFRLTVEGSPEAVADVDAMIVATKAEDHTKLEVSPEVLAMCMRE